MLGRGRGGAWEGQRPCGETWEVEGSVPGEPSGLVGRRWRPASSPHRFRVFLFFFSHCKKQGRQQG